MATRVPASDSPLRHWSADEGTEAHLFQLLTPVQALVIAYFAYTWLPRSPRLALALLALQLAAAAAVIALVYWLEHP